jgi:hydrogenase expression/formation protein HypE
MLTTTPKTDTRPRVMLAHGGGGELTKQLIAEHILPKLGNTFLSPLTDAAILPAQAGRLAVTTDAFVVQPLCFPGGDIGRLAVCGTINDLAVMGARPIAITLALIIEEGLSFDLFDRIMDSIAAAATEAGVPVVSGDTKVIERQPGDHPSENLTITTTGLGHVRDDVRLDARRITPGDVIIINGHIADHGLAVMSAREGLSFQTDLKTDAAPLNGLIHAVLDTGADVKFMRDPTRGGIAGTLADLVDNTGLTIRLNESAIPMTRVAHHTAEMLGLDPLTVANEGKVIIAAVEADAEKVITACKTHAYGRHAAVIGRVTGDDPPLVELETRAGGSRIVQRPYGEELPRIC